MTTSLILTTFNRKEALELVLLSALRQTELPDEIIVADDGSDNETAETIQRISIIAPIPLIHVWQEDKGFRAAKSRNKAMARASGTYIIFVDGDMLLHHRFVRDHGEMARPGFFSQGSRALLSAQKTARVIQEQQLRIFPFESGLGNRKNTLHSNILSRLFSRRKNVLRGIRTCNFAFWKKDAIAVNGFNEDFEGWGREDSEFAVRLLNHGISRQNIKFRAIAYHLYHPQHSRSSLQRNDEMLRNAIEQKITRCQNGLDKYLDCR